METHTKNVISHYSNEKESMDREMKTQKKRQKINLQKCLLQVSTTIYLLLMISVFPLIFDNYYLNIVLTKKNFFQWSTVGVLAVTLAAGVTAYLKERKQKNLKEMFSLTDLFAILFGCTMLISSMISPVGSEAFWGNEVRRLGGLFFLICIGAYFVVSRYYKTNRWLILAFLGTNLIACLIVIAQFFGFDVFHMYENLVVEQHLMFMGTMGNVNINAGYFSMVISLLMVFYYISTQRKWKICFWGMVVLGIYTCYCTRSDSWMLAVGTSFIVLLFWAVKEKETMIKWWSLCLAFLCGSFAIKLTEVVEANTEWTSFFVENVKANPLIATMTSVEVLMAESVLLLLFYFFIKSPYEWILQKYGRKIVIGLTILGVLGTVIYLYPLEDSFGNARGYIWKRSVWNFKEFSIIQKVFGYGPNCFYQALQANYGAEMLEKYKSAFYDAHNEILQFLTVSGILGVVSYMGMQISVIISGIQKKKNSSIAILSCVVVLSYIAQGLVNNPQVFTTPLLFLFLGIMENKIRNEEKIWIL